MKLKKNGDGNFKFGYVLISVNDFKNMFFFILPNVDVLKSYNHESVNLNVNIPAKFINIYYFFWKMKIK